MPPKHLRPDTLPLPLNHIPMTRHNALKIPLINPRHALVEALPVPRTRTIPNNSLLPLRVPSRTLQRAEDLGEYSRRSVYTGLAELLGGRQIEHHVCGNERLGGSVVEDKFLVHVACDIFPVELCVEFWTNRRDGLVFLEHKGKRNVLVALLLALLGECFGAQDLCSWVSGVPGAEEDVVLVSRISIWGGERVGRVIGLLRRRARRCISLHLVPRPWL